MAAPKDDKTAAKSGDARNTGDDNAPAAGTGGDKVPSPPEVKTAQAKAEAKNGKDDKDDKAGERDPLTAVDPRLDNRAGTQRPPLEEYPAKPQQIDGGDLSDMPDRPQPAHAIDDDPVARKGMRSPGPHGLGDTGGQ